MAKALIRYRENFRSIMIPLDQHRIYDPLLVGLSLSGTFLYFVIWTRTWVVTVVIPSKYPRMVVKRMEGRKWPERYWKVEE